MTIGLRWLFPAWFSLSILRRRSRSTGNTNGGGVVVDALVVMLEKDAVVDALVVPEVLAEVVAVV